MKITHDRYINLTGLLSILISLAIASLFWPDDSDAHGDRAIVVIVYGPVFIFLMLLIWWAFKWLGKFIYDRDGN